MKEISLHILDIVRNSINAGASLIEIKVTEDLSDNILAIEVNDNGKGMSTDILNRINDPFFTTDNKKTGLGIPLLRQHAEMCGGKCIILSEEYKGTRVLATFMHDHIDRQPLGDIILTVTNLIRSNPEKDFIYTHTYNDKQYSLDTREVKKQLENISISNGDVIRFIREMLSENLGALIT